MDLAVRMSRTTSTRYKEWRKLLEDKAVDAAVVSTPDHWHTLTFM